jgi:hypothetical protein
MKKYAIHNWLNSWLCDHFPKIRERRNKKIMEKMRKPITRRKYPCHVGKDIRMV